MKNDYKITINKMIDGGASERVTSLHVKNVSNACEALSRFSASEYNTNKLDGYRECEVFDYDRYSKYKSIKLFECTMKTDNSPELDVYMLYVYKCKAPVVI